MTLQLHDAAGLYFRAFYGVPESIRAPDGRPVNAIRGYLDMTARLISTRAPDRLVACLDVDWRPAFRVAALPSYKAHRVAPSGAEQVPDALTPQVPVLMEVLDAIGIARVGVTGYEADDVIGTLAAHAVDPVDVVTGDRDLFQVVREHPPVRVLYVARSVAKLEVLGPAEIAARYGIPAAAYADFAALRGDPSDGLPGVAGVGDKTAASLITRFGSLPGVLAAAKRGQDGFPAGSRGRILAAVDYLAVAPTVVRVCADLDMPDYDDRLPPTPRDPARLAELTAEYGLTSPVARVRDAIGAALGRA